MVIKKCSNCGNQFSYKDKLPSSFPRYKTLQCHVCGSKYETVFLSRLLCGVFIVFPNIVRIFWPGTSDFSITSLSLYILYLVILTFTYPFLEFYKLMENQE